jgi:hypothetical protein
MSWQDFKNSILLIANNPQSIPNTDVVAETYATAYNTAVKSGGDTVNKIPLKKGNLQSMQTLFKAALDKGVTMKGPYDLVAEMGAGVKSYWNAADMQLIIPITFATNGSENTQVITNKVTDAGIWIEPLKAPTPNTNTSSQTNTTPTPPKPADDYNLRKMLDEAGYAAIKKYEDEAGCTTVKSGTKGLAITDWIRVGCKGYNPGQDIQEQTIKERIKLVLGFDVWAKIPPLFRMQIYSFMYNSDSTADTTKNGVFVKGDKSRWIAGLLQAAKNQTAQYRTSVRTNETIRNTELPFLKTLTTADFQKIYPTYLKVLDEMYKSISDTELQSVAKKTLDSEKINALWLASSYNLTWKDRPPTIEKHYNNSTETKDSNQTTSTQSTTTSTSNTNTLPIKLAALNSGPIPPTNNTELIVDYFIRVATAHLTTIKGVAATKTKIGPGVVNWTGYTIQDTTTKKLDINEELNAEIDRFNAYLKSKGVKEEEEIDQSEDAASRGDSEPVTYTKYKGGTVAQKRAIQDSLYAVHKIGKYIDYKQPRYPNGIENTSVGFDGGFCARWTLNLAKNYAAGIKGNPLTNGPAFKGVANANEKGYWIALESFGYTKDVDTTFANKADLAKVLDDVTNYGIGDVVTYFGTDGIEEPGHTSIFTGGYGSDYPKAPVDTPTPNPKSKGKVEKWWFNVSNWDSDAYNNFGTSFVYRNKEKTSKTWRLIIFRAPTK